METNMNRPRGRRLPGPRPGQFALGSIQSRAAARMKQVALAEEAREQQNALLANSSPAERALMEALGGDYTTAGSVLARAILNKAEMFHMDLPKLRGFRASKDAAAVRAPDAT